MAVPLRFLLSIIYSLNNLEKNIVPIVVDLTMCINFIYLVICMAQEGFYVEKKTSFTYKGDIIKRIVPYFKWNSLCYVGLAILFELLQIGVHLYKKNSDGFHVSFLEPYNIYFWRLPLCKSNFTQEYLLIGFYKGIIERITYMLLRLKIKGYSINDTLY